MRFLFAIFVAAIASLIITPIGGAVVFCLIYFTSKKKPQTFAQNIYINNGVPENNYSSTPGHVVSEEEIAEKLKNDQKKNVLRELDILDKKYRRNLITFDEYQERIKQLSK